METKERKRGKNSLLAVCCRGWLLSVTSILLQAFLTGILSFTGMLPRLQGSGLEPGTSPKNSQKTRVLLMIRIPLIDSPSHLFKQLNQTLTFKTVALILQITLVSFINQNDAVLISEGSTYAQSPNGIQIHPNGHDTIT